MPSKYFSLGSVGAGIFIYWYNAERDLSFALERMVTVMVTSCPHALGVAIPLVVALSTTLSDTHGLLIRNRTAFENARKLTTIIFDKTGTLTKGSHEVAHIISIDNRFTADEILQFAAAIQQNSEHHIARGVLRKLKEMRLALWKSENFTYLQGVGVSGIVNGKSVVAAGPNYFKQNLSSLPAIPDTVDQDIETVNFVLIDNTPAGIITLADSIRETSAEDVAELKSMVIKSFFADSLTERMWSAWRVAVAI